MSFELLLVLAVFVLLPLVQLVVRGAGQGDRRVLDHAEGGVPSTKQPTKPEPAMAAPPVPHLPASARHTVSHAMTARTRTSRRDAVGLAARGPIARHGGRRHNAWVAGLDGRNGLRSAIVLAAILGPCRANDPHARSESGLP
jgi:hypothetical protein